MPISFRRANIPIRKVLATSPIAETSMMTAMPKTPSDNTLVSALSRSSSFW